MKREPDLIESDALAIAELRIRIVVIRLMYCSRMIPEDSIDAFMRVAALTRQDPQPQGSYMAPGLQTYSGLKSQRAL